MADLRTMSASALKNWESCPAYAGATSLKRVPTESGPAADLGTAVHAALEYLVKGMYLDKTVPVDQGPGGLKLLLRLFDEAYKGLFGSDESMYADGVEMLTHWWGRQRWEEWNTRTVLSCEVKTSFPVPTSIGDIPFNYIWDRADQVGEDEYEVVDYKSWRWARDHDDMRQDIQVRCYALAAQIKWPNAKKIWVTLDQIRYDTVSVAIRREANVATWKWLKKVAAEIIAAEEPLEEKINSNCRFCPRKSSCGTLLQHVAVGGDLGVQDMGQAAALAYTVGNKITALTQLKEQLDAFMGEYFRRTDVKLWEDENFKVEMGGRANRFVRAEQAAQVLDPQTFARYAKFNMGSVDALLKGSEIDQETKARLKALIGRTFSGSTPKVKPKGALHGD